MKANTIKLEADLLAEIYPLLKPKQSLASYVREVLRKETRSHKMTAAANTYSDFLQANPEEVENLSLWSNSDLENAPYEKSQLSNSKRSAKKK